MGWQMITQKETRISCADCSGDSTDAAQADAKRGLPDQGEVGETTDYKAAEPRYRMVVEDLTEVISRFREDGTITYVNEVYCRFFGKQPRELIGKKWQPAAVAEDLPHIEAKLRTISPSHPVVTIENRVYSGTGRVVWMQFVNRAFFDKQGRLTEIQSVGRDISERKLAELSLRDSEERYRSLFSSNIDAVLLTTPDGRILTANEAACGMFCRSEEELIEVGRGGIADASDPRLPLALEERSRTGRFHGELTFLRKGGMKFPGEVSSTVFTDRHGRLCTSMVIRDITKRKRAEEALRFSREQLQALSRRLVELHETSRRELARELHDRVGQNLTALSIKLNVISTLAASDLPQSIGKHVDDCLKLVAETTDSIRDVMAELRPTVLDDFGLLVALRWYGRQFSSRTGLAVEVLCPVPFPRLARERETSLFRIVQEALTNVVKHAQAGHVVISAEAIAAKLMISVTDDGIGFDQGWLDPQTGWGMTIMRERALTAGGELEVQSSPGKGTTVRVEVKNHGDSGVVGG
jgi:two-component system, NarL family, sensor histidine kinase UhpB